MAQPGCPFVAVVRVRSLYRKFHDQLFGDFYYRYLHLTHVKKLRLKPHGLVHPDEEMFRAVHQCHEIHWMVITGVLDRTIESLGMKKFGDILYDFPKASLLIEMTISELKVLIDNLSREAFGDIRKKISAGSGITSPGFRNIRERIKPLRHGVRNAVHAEPLLNREQTEKLVKILDLVIHFGFAIQGWRRAHYALETLMLGKEAEGTFGMTNEVLEERSKEFDFPDFVDYAKRLTIKLEEKAS